MLASLSTIANELYKDLGLKPLSPFTAHVDKSASLKSIEPSYVVNFTKQLSYFGKSMAVGDFDGDGIKEVFIGAPGYSLKGQG